MEEYSGYTRFILTANYKHKIIPAIQSRTQYFDLTPPLQEVSGRVVSILKLEKIKVPDTEKTKLVKVIKDNYPDIRKTINLIQKYSATGTLTITVNVDTSAIAKVVHDYVKSKKLTELRKHLIENESEFQGDYGALLKHYLNFLYDNTELKEDTKRKAIVIIAEHLYRDAMVLDKEINAFACFCQLSDLT